MQLGKNVPKKKIKEISCCEWDDRFEGQKDPDPLVRGTDPVPDPSIIKQK
jgi:hypothetical protein